MASRETGVVRQRLGGDTAAAQRLSGVARTQLGILKEQMAFGGLQQLSRTVRLGDGTEIFVQSVLGQDSVRITPPVAAVEVVGEEEEVSVAGSYVYVAGFSGGHAFRWKVSADGRGVLAVDDLGPSAGDSLGMSSDGSVVVFGRLEPDGYTYACRWAAETGVVNLGAAYLGAAPYPSILVSSDGSVVGVSGYDYVLGESRQYRWTAGTGLVDFGVTVLSYGDYSPAWGMSDDGSTFIFLEFDVATQVTNWCCWRNGSLSRYAVISGASGAHFEPAGISRDGSTMFFTGAVSPGGIRFYVWDGASPPIDVAETYGFYRGEISADGSAVVFGGALDSQSRFEWLYWSRATGIQRTGMLWFPENLSLYRNVSLSSDGTRFIATDATGAFDRGKISQYAIETGGVSDLGLEFFYNVPVVVDASDDFSASIVSGRMAATGRYESYRIPLDSVPIYLGPAGSDSVAYDMANDGVVMVGASGNSHMAWTPVERVKFGSASLYSPILATKIFYD